MGFFCENRSIQEDIQFSGVSPCFYDTISTSGQILVVTVALLVQCHLARKRVEKSSSVAYISKMILITVIFAEEFFRFIWRWKITYGLIYGVDVFYIFGRLMVFLLTVVIIRYEHITLVTTKVRLPLLLSRCIIFAIDFIPIISIGNERWWFQLQSTDQKVHFTIWITKLVAELVLILLIVLDQKDGTQKETEFMLKEKEPAYNPDSWKETKHRAQVLWSYTWPRKNLRLQLQFFVCIVFLLFGRAINLYVPIYNKNIVNALIEKRSWNFLLSQVGIFVTLKFLQGGSFRTGVLNGVRSILWVEIQQFTNKRVQTDLLGHLHSLSFRWHLSRKTGGVLRSIDRGMESIDTLTMYIFFVIIPTFIDIIIALIFFATRFNVWLALLVFVCIAVYMAATVLITDWRKKFARAMHAKDNVAKQRAIDSLLNFETVKYYNAEEHEVNKFSKLIDDFQVSEFKTNASFQLLTLVQSLIINLGLLSGALLCIRYVLDGTFNVGFYVLFVTYLVQLYLPLNFFGLYYQIIQNNLLAMEDMFRLFDEKSEVVDNPDSYSLQLTNTAVEFKNVCFHYSPTKPILRDVSFTVNPGETVALVGNSGSGKSTIIRLLLRFFDIQSGVITIGGDDIAKLTQSSLRQHMGVVPQDTVLFNDTIEDNIRYGRVTASDEEVREAARAADIHERINLFPEQYSTLVGERGLRLSGGEKQRVAIARTILKAPKMLLLDEATSALDTTTERNIQTSLNRVCEGKTTIVVAHRLSTVVNADCIIVLKEGVIVERGRHQELLELDGEYSKMWENQLTEGDKDEA